MPLFFAQNRKEKYVQQQLDTTKRQKKSKETRKKLLDAMEFIMEKYDYNTVTIRNICKVSGVSYGSFYNLFGSKENFLRYYLTSDFVAFKEDYYRFNTDFEKLSDTEKSVDIFVCCAKYNLKKGLKFISGFYSPLNYTLCPLGNEGGKEYSFTPLVEEASGYLERAREEGNLKADADIESTVNDYCFLFNGITFNWCISRGRYDIVRIVRSSLLERIQKEMNP